MDFLKDKVANVADMANYAAGEGPPPKQRRCAFLLDTPNAACTGSPGLDIRFQTCGINCTQCLGNSPLTACWQQLVPRGNIEVAATVTNTHYYSHKDPPPRPGTRSLNALLRCCRVSASQLGDGKACGSGDTDAPAVRGRGRGSRGGGRGGGRGRGRTVRQPSLTAAAPAPAGPSPLPDAAAAHAAHAGTMAGPPDAAGVHGPGALPTCTAERCPGGGSGALPAAGASAHAGASAGSAACPATTAAQRSEVLRRKPAFLYARGGGTGPLGAGRGGARTAFAFKSSTANSSTAKAGTAAVAAAVPRAGTVLPGSAASAPDTADTGVVLAAATSECRGAAPHLSAVIPEEDDYDAD